VNQEEKEAVQRLSDALDRMWRALGKDLAHSLFETQAAHLDVQAYLSLPIDPATTVYPDNRSETVYTLEFHHPEAAGVNDPDYGEWRGETAHSAETLPEAMEMLGYHPDRRRRIIRCDETYMSSYTVIKEAEAEPDDES
jgi:hypothetical protein